MTDSPYKSQGERKIAKFLTDYGLDFVYEQPLLVNDYGKIRVWYPDFNLPEYATIIEYFGGVGDEDYNRGIFRKTKAYSELYLNLVPMFPKSFEGDWQARTIEKIGEGLEERLTSFYEKVNMKSGDMGTYPKARRRTYSI